MGSEDQTPTFILMLNFMKLPYLLLLLLLTACALQSEPVVEKRTAELVLNASVTEGIAPLEATFTTTLTADDGAALSASAYTWTLAGTTLPDTAPDLTHTFEKLGVYIVVAMAETPLGSASDSITVSVTEPDAPPENPGEPVQGGTINVTQTPGGPAPWAVRYTVQAEGYGADAQVKVRCSGGSSYEEVEGAVCLHRAADERAQVDILVNGDIIDSVEVASEVTPPQEGIAFLGEWRYDSRGQSESFEITSGTAAAGESEDGAFKLFLIELDGLDIAEFTFGGRTVVLTPIPEEDGTQVFFADVYGLRLERLDGAP